MKISDIRTHTITIPLTTTFKTALRSVDAIENVLVALETDSGLTGFGSAAPTAVITGETAASINGAIAHIGTIVAGMEIKNHEKIFQALNKCIVGNYSAKAAVDMAIYDLLAKSLDVPLYRLLGGIATSVLSDITISLGEVETMAEESRRKINEGFRTLKIKVGGDPETDIARLEAISDAIEGRGTLRIDANQGWTGKQAVWVARELRKRKIAIELMEQPVAAQNHDELKYVKEKCPFPVYADESVFTEADALALVKAGAVDGINIKLMKCGGIYNALKIAAIAEAAGIPCMIGSMMECSISVTAAAHLAASRTVIGKYDLDAPLFCSSNPAAGGISYQGPEIQLPDTPGLGIEPVSFQA